MNPDVLTPALKVLAVLGTLAALIWGHGSWVSGVNMTMAETGRTMVDVSDQVQANTASIAKVKTDIVSIEADVWAVKEDSARIEALATQLSTHVGDLREVTAELKVLVRKINGREMQR